MCNLYEARSSAEERPAIRRASQSGRSDRGQKGLCRSGQARPHRAGAGRPTHSVGNEFGLSIPGRPVTNVRNYTSPFWKSALANPSRRCLVPVTEFQEWSVEPMPDTGKKKPFWFRVPSQPVFAFAGIWRPTECLPVYSFLTCGYDGDAATHVVGAIHPKASPVILHPEDYDRWLRADFDDALSLACAYPSQLMAVGDV